MKTINRLLILVLSLLAIVACDNDGDRITLSGVEEAELVATETDAVLTQDNSTAVVLSLAWTEGALYISDTTMGVPDILKTTLQVSKTSDFSGTIDETETSALSFAYLGAELNTVAKDLETTPGVATPLYFRLARASGDNMDPVYSNVITVNVTSYEIDMTIAYVLSSGKEPTAATLYSAESDGEYLGFMGASGWYNYYLQEGDGSIWGNDAVSGTAFVISTASDVWNCWFPEPAGCYYVDFNTNDEVWSAENIPVLTVSGDISGDMTFDKASVTWTLAFTATSTSNTIKISGDGHLYDNSTGDKAYTETSIAFAQSGDTLVTLADDAGDIVVTVPATGDYTLALNLSNPTVWSIKAVQGASSGPTIYQKLYLPGCTEGTGAWTFDQTIPLYDEDALAYAGVVNVNSAYGYSINVEKDNWSDKYDWASGDAYSGTLAYASGTNIPAPDAGVYLFDVSLSDSTYNLTGVTDTIYLSGLNDNWDFSVYLLETATAGTYSGNITISSASEWGFQIHLDKTWGHYFGGASGSLYYKGSNITDDASLAAGIYTMTVDLIGATYSIAQ